MQLSFFVADAILRISTTKKHQICFLPGLYPAGRFPFCSISGVFSVILVFPCGSFLHSVIYSHSCSFMYLTAFPCLRFLLFHKFPQFFSFHYTDLTVSAADPFFLVKILEHRSHCRPVQSKGICQFAVRIGHDSS